MVLLRRALAAVAPVLSSLLFHRAPLLPDKAFCLSQATASLLGSWLLWSGNLDRRVFLWGGEELAQRRFSFSFFPVDTLHNILGPIKLLGIVFVK